jgi:hypothetical protein
MRAAVEANEPTIAELIAAWDVFHKHLPHGEYKGLGELSLIIGIMRKSQSSKSPDPQVEWVCEGCGLSGKTEYLEDEGAFAAVHAIRTHHADLVMRLSVGCLFNIDRLRVRNPRTMDVFAWNRYVVEIEKKSGRRKQ